MTTTTTTIRHARANELVIALDRFLEAAANATKWRTLTPGFKQVHPDVRAAFLEQGDQLLAKANAAARESARVLPLGVGLLGPLREASLTASGWDDAWTEVSAATEDLLLEPIQTAAGLGMKAGADALGRTLEIDVAFSLGNPAAVEYLESRGGAWIADINSTTRDRIKTILVNGAKEGLSYQQIAAQIEALFVDFAGPAQGVIDVLLGKEPVRSRAEVISITELGNAFEAGNFIVAQDLAAGGLEMEKAWKTVNDHRVDQDICAANQAQGWIPLSDAFQSGHLSPMGHPICRCYAAYRRRPD
jgi:hypothetical protein